MDARTRRIIGILLALVMGLAPSGGISVPSPGSTTTPGGEGGL